MREDLNNCDKMTHFVQLIERLMHRPELKSGEIRQKYRTTCSHIKNEDPKVLTFARKMQEAVLFHGEGTTGYSAK